MFNKTDTKYIQSLHHKKFRDQNDVFFAEGTKVVTELLAAGNTNCLQLFAQLNWLHQHENLIKELKNTEIIVVKDFELEKISALSTPNLVLAVFKKIINKPINVKGKLTIVLDSIQDPGNLGTILRTADWFGVENIICSPTTADIYNSKVVQSTMGSLARVNVQYFNLVEWLSNTNGIKKIAAALDGNVFTNYSNVKEAILIVGNEGKGISKEVLNWTDEKITIPKLGNAESLNAAVAAGIILATFKST